MITESWLAELGGVAAKATPGPWEYDGQHYEISTPRGESYWLIISESRSAPDQEHPPDEFGHQYDANYAFIAAAREAVPKLIAEVRRLQAENAAMARDE